MKENTLDFGEEETSGISNFVSKFGYKSPFSNWLTPDIADLGKVDSNIFVTKMEGPITVCQEVFFLNANTIVTVLNCSLCFQKS